LLCKRSSVVEHQGLGNVEHQALGNVTHQIKYCGALLSVRYYKASEKTVTTIGP
jgi:hypothetical protein